MELFVEPWANPEELSSKLPPVPTFDIELLPSSLRDMVSDVARRMQVPVDFPAVVSIATLAGVCGRRALIRPKANDDSWEVVPNLWGAIIADAGMMKSPVIRAVTAPALAVENKWRAEYECDFQNYTVKKRRWTLDLEVSDAAYKRYRRVRKPGDPETPPDSLNLQDEPKPPSQRRLITTDATLESLHKLLEQNPGGLFVLRDELTGWLTNLEKMGRESERAFYLECWNGDSHFTLDRIGRGSIYVQNCCVSLFGGIQPARLKSYFADALELDGADNDGLIQRFQLLIWPDKCPNWVYEDYRADTAAFRRAEQVYRGIAELDPKKPLRLRFSEDAQGFFADWLTNLMNVEIQGEDLHVSLESHFSKYRSLMPSLALLLSLADSTRDVVALDYAEKAARWCGYLMGHAKRVYASRSDPAHSAALVLARKIETGKLPNGQGKFSLRDVYRNGWRELSTVDQARGAIRILEEHCWIRRFAERDLWEEIGIKKTGRPSEIYEIHPQVLNRQLRPASSSTETIQETASTAN